MRNYTAIAVFFSLLVAMTHTTSAETLYRWKNSDGSPVVSDRPPPAGVEYETISTTSSVVHRVESGSDKPGVADQSPSNAPPTPAASPSKPTSRLHEKNPEYCAAARQNLEVIDRAPRIRVDDGNGGLRYLSDEERAAQRQDNLEIIEAHCP